MCPARPTRLSRGEWVAVLRARSARRLPRPDQRVRRPRGVPEPGRAEGSDGLIATFQDDTGSGGSVVALVVGTFGAVCAASGAIGTVVKAVNRAYDRLETRSCSAATSARRSPARRTSVRLARRRHHPAPVAELHRLGDPVRRGAERRAPPAGRHPRSGRRVGRARHAGPTYALTTTAATDKREGTRRHRRRSARATTRGSFARVSCARRCGRGSRHGAG
jgi:hypothetical protein